MNPCQPPPVIFMKLLEAERSSIWIGTSHGRFEVPMCTLKFPFEDFNFNFDELSSLDLEFVHGTVEARHGGHHTHREVRRRSRSHVAV